MILPATDETIQQAVAMLAAGELVGLPTETVYGLAANAWDASAASKIFAAKSRPATNPLIVHLAGIERLSDAVAWPPPMVIRRQIDSLADLWPGPLTIVCPRNTSIPDVVTAGRSTVAVRVPAHSVARQLLHACPFPLAAPSANRSGYISPTLARHVDEASGLGSHVSLVIDGGPCTHGIESTIVLLGERPRLLRPGSITAEALVIRLGVDLADFQPSTAETLASADHPLAPGMLREHYAPATPLVLVDQAGAEGLGQRRPEEQGGPGQGGPGQGVDGEAVGTAAANRSTVGNAAIGRIAFQPLPEAEHARYRVVETLSTRGDLEEVARHLFAALRRLDAAGLEVIHCDTCPEEGLGRAIMDRLRRAAARTRSQSTH